MSGLSCWPWAPGQSRRNQVPDLYYRSHRPDADFEEAGAAGAEEDFERCIDGSVGA
jgi:hypothetical protein